MRPLVLAALLLLSPAALAGGAGAPPRQSSNPVDLREGQAWTLSGVDESGQKLSYGWTVGREVRDRGRQTFLTTLGSLSSRGGVLVAALTKERSASRRALFCIALPQREGFRGILVSGSDAWVEVNVLLLDTYAQEQSAARRSLPVGTRSDLECWMRLSGATGEFGTCELKPF